MKLRLFSSPSFWVGFAISVALILLGASLIICSVSYVTLEGETKFTGRPLLVAHPWLVFAGCILAGAITFLGDLYHRRVMIRARAIFTSLQAMITTALIMIILFKFAPTIEIEPDIPAIQKHLFGEHGKFLREADKIVLYSTKICPYEAQEGVPEPRLFHGFEVLGSTNIDDHEIINDIGLDLQKRLQWNRNTSSYVMCFWPRHGLRAFKDDQTQDYHICFECQHLFVYSDIESKDYVRFELMKLPPSKLLNGLLDEAGIERTKSPLD